MIDPHITPQIAADVLASRNGGYASSLFVHHLLKAIASASTPDRASLAAIYPGYVAAWEIAAFTDSGTDILRVRARDSH
ncbi:hypothetical protein ACQP1V_43140 (plasmid) [Microtetraspora malaysiensis]|uniref:hypothetical protein n=1 Tax=Microtetraspora malaysiensis TaxID=161358 RepID=UPI003D92942D